TRICRQSPVRQRRPGRLPDQPRTPRSRHSASRPAPGRSGAPAVSSAVVFGSVPFDAPWLTEHNLAVALADRLPVEWVDPPHSPLTRGRTRPADVRAPFPVV